MARIAYVNGAYVPQSEAAVNVEDRGYQFGDGIYEVVHVHGGRFVDEALHLDRLERSLREIRIPMPMSRAALRQVLGEVLRRNRVREGIVYMQVTRGVAKRDHAFPTRPIPPALVVTARRLPPYPRDVTRWTATCITVPDQRWARRDIKSVNLLPNVLARQAARDAGCTEAIMYDPSSGEVTEGASTSVWIVDGEGVLRTRQLDHAVLPGCTRGALLAELEAEGIPCAVGRYDLATLEGAREIFLTSASSFVKPVVRLNGKPVGDGTPGPLTRRLFDLFARHVRGTMDNAA